MRQYIGVIHRDRDSDFGVSFPDFPVSSRPALIWTTPVAWPKKLSHSMSKA